MGERISATLLRRATWLLLGAAVLPKRMPSRRAVRTFRLARMKIRPCENCGGCDKTGVCIIEGDEMPQIPKALRTALPEAFLAPLERVHVSSRE